MQFLHLLGYRYHGEDVRSSFSSGTIIDSISTVTEADELAFQELAQRLQGIEEAKSAQEIAIREERNSHQAGLRKVSDELQDAEGKLRSERERADALERQLEQARAQIDKEIAARKLLERCNAEQAQELEEARSRDGDLEAQINIARAENTERLLKEFDGEKEKLLQVQATQHNRTLQDYIAQANADRDASEQRFSELEAKFEMATRQLGDMIQQLGDAQSNAELTNTDACGLRVELQRVEGELKETRRIEDVLRQNLAADLALRSDFEQRLEDSSRIVAQLLDICVAFRNTHCKALSTLRAMTVHPNAKQHGQNHSMMDSAFSPHLRHGADIGEPPPIDPSDVSGAVETLRVFDHDLFLDAVTKAGSVIRKWQKQCKEYRERAKAKISFRNFTKGDLALFLPTRNSVSKPWAAFNGELARCQGICTLTCL